MNNNRDRHHYVPFPSLAGPWPNYVPGASSAVNSPRFPYNITGSRYVPGSVVHGPSQYGSHASSPAPSYSSRSSVDRSSVDRYSRASSSLSRQQYEAEEYDEPDPVVFNAGFTFRMGKESRVHKHVEAQPAYTIPEAQSSGLTRQIDKFLKKSDHTLDRYQDVIQSRSSSGLSGLRGKSMTPGFRDDSPEPSLCLSSHRSGAAASIAVKAEKHLETMGRIGGGRKATAPIAEREEDGLDTSSSASMEGLDDTEDDAPRSTDMFDISDDTSADLSKLDDLSSDSDDEYYDVVAVPGLRPLLSPQIATQPPKPSVQPAEPPRIPPTHSQSLPAINKKGIAAATSMGNPKVSTPCASKGPKQLTKNEALDNNNVCLPQNRETVITHKQQKPPDNANHVKQPATDSEGKAKGDSNKMNSLLLKAVTASKKDHQSSLEVIHDKGKEVSPLPNKDATSTQPQTSPQNPPLTDRSMKASHLSKEKDKQTDTPDPHQQPESQKKESSDVLSTDQCSDLSSKINVDAKPSGTLKMQSSSTHPTDSVAPNKPDISKTSKDSAVNQNLVEPCISSASAVEAVTITGHGSLSATNEQVSTSAMSHSQVTSTTTSGQPTVVTAVRQPVASSAPSQPASPGVAGAPDINKRIDSASKQSSQSTNNDSVTATSKPDDKDSKEKNKKPKKSFPVTGKNRPGSPVPGKSAVLGIKMAPPVVKGKLNISVADGSEDKVSIASGLAEVQAPVDPLKQGQKEEQGSAVEKTPVASPEKTSEDKSGKATKEESKKKEKNTSVDAEKPILKKESGLAIDKNTLNGHAKTSTDTAKPEEKIESMSAAVEKKTLDCHSKTSVDTTKPEEKVSSEVDKKPLDSHVRTSVDTTKLEETKESVSSVVNKKPLDGHSETSANATKPEEKKESVSGAVEEKPLDSHTKTSADTAKPGEKKESVSGAVEEKPLDSHTKTSADTAKPGEKKEYVSGAVEEKPLNSHTKTSADTVKPGEKKESVSGATEKQSLDCLAKASADIANPERKKESESSNKEKNISSPAKPSADTTESELKGEPGSGVEKKQPLESLVSTTDLSNKPKEEKKDVELNNKVESSVMKSSGQNAQNASNSRVANEELTRKMGRVKIDAKVNDIPDSEIEDISLNLSRRSSIADDTEDFSIDTCLDRSSRCSSVLSDISRAMSPDASVRSTKRSKSGKIAALADYWDIDDISQISERSKPKKSSGPKVGKISGLASKFETGTIVNQTTKTRDVRVKSPEPKPLGHSASIGGINPSKFGPVGKFKKPEPKRPEELKKKEKKALPNGEIPPKVLRDEKGKIQLKEPAKTEETSDKKNDNTEKPSEKDGTHSNDKKSETIAVSDGGSDAKHIIAEKANPVPNGDVKLEEKTESLDETDSKSIKKKKKKKKEKSEETAGNVLENAEKNQSKVKIPEEKVNKLQQSDTANVKSTKAEPSVNDKTIVKDKSTKDEPSAKEEASSNEASVTNLKGANNRKSEEIAQELVNNQMSKDDSKNSSVTATPVSNDTKLKDGVDKKVVTFGDSLVHVNKEGSSDDKLKKSEIDDAQVSKDSSLVRNVEAENTPKHSESKVAEAGDLSPKEKNDVSCNKNDTVKSPVNNHVSVDGETLKTKSQDASKKDTGKKDKLGGIKSFIESVAKGGKSLEDKLSKSGINVGKLSFKRESSKENGMGIPLNTGKDEVGSKVAEKIHASIAAGQNVVQTIAKAVPELESEVDALIKEAAVLLGPEEKQKKLLSGTLKAATAADTPRRTSSGEEGEEEVFVDAVDQDILMPLPDRAERDRRSCSRPPMEGAERSCSPSPVVAQAEALLSETDRLLRRSRSNKSLRRSYSRSLSAAALNLRLSEVTADLSEEHTTAHLAGERLEAEQAERMKLEKELDRLQTDVKRMTTENGKLEMEKLALRTEVLVADLNGDVDDDEDYAADASLYKRKYEWCLREMELLKKQLKQQHEDDLDQLLLLKKQLEKKVSDAYEETDEQRQVVAQLKRKSQRLQAEMNDLKILLEEQTSRNNLLEKKQRKFDQEMMTAQEELRQERSSKDKIQRERDQILSEKYSLEQEASTLKLELELKEEKVSALNRELEDLSFTGKAEEEVAALKKAKHDLELRIKDQEEELDDLAGQVQMLEGAKVRLEMSIEQMRKENRREMSQREEEIEEIRISAQKKVKALESQLENEHEERTLLVREKHELERRVADLQDRTITHVDEDYVHKLKKELKKTKALLRDTQTMLEKAQSEGSHKVLVRQLKTQLEDAEFAKNAAIKARQCADADLGELSSQLEEAQRIRKEAEDKCARISKDRAEIQTQLEESEEEVAEVMKKYKAVVSQLSVDQITLSEQSQQIAELEHTKQVLQERMLELNSKVEVLEGETANIHTQRRLEMKIKEVESKLELEQTTRQRLESQISRLKDQVERLTSDCDSARMKESQATEQCRRVNRQLREAKEDVSALQQRHTEAVNKKSELEKQLELSDAEVVTLKSDLKLAFKRIEDLQQAIQGDLSDSDSDLSDSDSDSDGSLSSYLTASWRQNQRSSSNSTLRTPPSEMHHLDRAELPNSPCSEAMSAISEDLDDASVKESYA